MENLILIQQLTQHTYYNLSNLNQTFSKVENSPNLFFDNEIGDLYQIVDFLPKLQVFIIKQF